MLLSYWNGKVHNQIDCNELKEHAGITQKEHAAIIQKEPTGIIQIKISEIKKKLY